MLSLPRSRSLCGSDHRNLASRSTLPPCCKASQTHATCSGEKAREEAALTSSSVRTASVLGVVRSMDNSAASSATSLMHSRLSTSFTFSLLMSFAIVTSPAEEEDIFFVQAFPGRVTPPSSIRLPPRHANAIGYLTAAVSRYLSPPFIPTWLLLCGDWSWKETHWGLSAGEPGYWPPRAP